MTPNQAKESAYARVRAAWLASAYAALPLAFDRDTLRPSIDQGWARCALRHVDSEQTSMGSVGNRRYERRAILLIEVASPLITDTGGKVADLMAQVFVDAIEGVHDPDAISYFATTPREMDSEGAFAKVAVDIPITYQEIK